MFVSVIQSQLPLSVQDLATVRERTRSACHLLALDRVKLDPEFKSYVEKRASDERRDGGMRHLAVEPQGIGCSAVGGTCTSTI